MSILESRRLFAVLLSVVMICLLANVLVWQFSRPVTGATSADTREIVPLSGGFSAGIHGGPAVIYAIPGPPGAHTVIGYFEMGSNGVVYHRTQTVPAADFDYVQP